MKESYKFVLFRERCRLYCLWVVLSFILLPTFNDFVVVISKLLESFMEIYTFILLGYFSLCVYWISEVFRSKDGKVWN